MDKVYIVYTVCPKKVTPLNVWLWQVQACTRLHIIKRTQALMYFYYWHQILYKSVVPFSRFSIFTKSCRKVQLPAALLLLSCVQWPSSIRKRSTFFPLILSVGISSLGHTKLIFYWSSCEGKWFALPVDYAIWGFCMSECIVTRLVKLTIWKNDWFMNCATLISLSLTEQSSSSNSIS